MFNILTLGVPAATISKNKKERVRSSLMNTSRLPNSTQNMLNKQIRISSYRLTILFYRLDVYDPQPLQEQKMTHIHKRSNTNCVNHVMRIENPLPLVRGGRGVHHQNSLTNSLTNENNRICNHKITHTMIRHRLVEPLRMCKPLVSLPSLAWPLHLLQQAGKSEGKAYMASIKKCLAFLFCDLRNLVELVNRAPSH